MTDETRLEDAFRAGLQRRADDVDTTVDLLGPVAAAARGRRRRTWVAGPVGLAAAALVTAVVVQNVGSDTDQDAVGQPKPDRPSEPLPTEWRTEAWHGVQVDVPADWGWGAAPTGTSGAVDDFIRCGGPDDAEPYVGRPVASSDMCQGVDVQAAPEADYVWFDALPVGSRDLGNGYFQATVGMGGTTVTVTTDNLALGQRIQDSIRPVEGCAASIAGEVAVDSMLIEGLQDPESGQVCAYAPVRSSLNYDLVYATTLDREQASIYHSQVYDGGRQSSPEFCDDAMGNGERVLITITGEDPFGGPGAEVTQDTVVDPGCREVSGSPGMVTPLSDKGMDAWAQGGLPVTLYGLIGPQG